MGLLTRPQTTLQLFKSFVLSLVAQLIARLPTLPDFLVNEYRTGQHTPSLGDLERLLLELIRQFGDVYIVIDSLDECSERARLIKWITKIVSSQRTLHLLATSRPEPDIQRPLLALDSCVALGVDEEGISRDMGRHIDEMLASRWTESGRAEVKSALLGDGGGVFRLLDFQLKAFQKCTSLRDAKIKLQTLPKTLQDMYDSILLNLDEHRAHALELLTWLAFSIAPLRLEAIAEIGIVILQNVERDGLESFDDDGRLLADFILGDCSNLITTLTVRHYVKLVHVSIKEHIFSSNSTSIFKISELDAHISISQSCLVYLMYYSQVEINGDIEVQGGGNGIDKDWEDILDSSLLWYASSRWVYHVHSAGGDHVPGLLHLLQDFFNSDNPAFLIYQPIHAYGSANPLVNACELGLPNVAWRLIESGADVEAQEEKDGNNPLHAASYGGLIEIVCHLLEKGVDANVKGGAFGNSLRAAAHQGHVKIVRVLLENGADINADGGSALKAAVSIGSIEIVLLLLEMGADVNANGGIFGNALLAAAYGGHTEIVRILLEYGAHVDARGLLNESALDLATYCGYTDIVRILMEGGADVVSTERVWLDSAFKTAPPSHLVPF